MPFLIFAAGAILAVYFFIIWTRNATDVASDLVDMAGDVRLAKFEVAKIAFRIR